MAAIHGASKVVCIPIASSCRLLVIIGCLYMFACTHYVHAHAGKAHGTRSSKMASSKNFRLVDTWEASTSRQPAETNWDLCVLCQQETVESLVCPLH